MNNISKLPALIALTVVCMLVVLFGEAVASLRAIAGILLVLFIPGYAITRAAFPARTWGTAERIMFSLGSSLSLAVVSGLVLNSTRWGLQTVSWTLFLGIVSVLAASIGSFRKRDAQMHGGVLAGRINRRDIRINRRDIVLLALAGLLVISAYGIAAYGASVRPIAQFTQLWMMPSEQPERAVRIGIRNEEHATTDYRLVVRAGVEIVQEWPTITLETGQEWETVVTLDFPQASTEDLVASLYRQDQPNAVYRYVTLRSQG